MELGWSTMDEKAFYTHWARRGDDGKLTCSCGYIAEIDEELFELFFRQHAHVEWVKLLVARGRFRLKSDVDPKASAKVARKTTKSPRTQKSA